MKTKNIFSFILVFILALTIISCGDKSEDPTPQTQNQNNQTPVFTPEVLGFWYSGDLSFQISEIYLGMDQNNLSLLEH